MNRKAKARTPTHRDPVQAQEQPLTMFTIYERPKDYPRHFVVRKWTSTAGEPSPGECQLADSLDEARKLVPWQCIRLDRMAADDPFIVETWI